MPGAPTAAGATTTGPSAEPDSVTAVGRRSAEATRKMIREMRSRSAAVVIAFGLFWSAFATYGQVLSAALLAGPPVELARAAEPVQHAPSTAADPQQPQPDDSAASSEVEGGGDPSELIHQSADARVPALAMAPPRPHEAAAWRAPPLDGPRRPPRAGLPTA